MGTLVKSTLSALYKYSGAMHAQERLRAWSGQRPMSVLLFHRVTDEIPEDGITVSTTWFRAFCKLMRDRFHVVPLAELHRLLTTRETPPLRTVAITFDDCYRDNLAAAQLLHDHQLPATFFIPTQYVGTDHVFPWDVGLKRMPNLTWADVRAIQSLGHEIGSHTVSHPDLGRLGVDEVRRELADSKRTLEETLGRRVRFFAYPFGGVENFRPEHLPLVYELGYEACFSAINGFVTSSSRGRILPRVPMPYFRSLTHLEVYLTGCLEWFHRLKHGKPNAIF